jgi:two-component system NtrC family sensor kinase
MKRTLTVIVLASAALALLVAAALKSRSIPLQSHIAQFTLESDITRLTDDHDTLIAAFEAAWQSGQAPGEAASALRERIIGSVDGFERTVAEIPGSRPQRDRIENSLERLRSSVTRLDQSTRTLLDQEAQYAESLSFLRDQGPEVVRDLRQRGQDRVATDIFQLIAQTIEYADPSATSADDDIQRLLVTLDRDKTISGRLPAAADALLNAIMTIIESRNDTRSRLTYIGTIPLIENANALKLAASTAYQSAVSGAESARTMLSAYAAVLLLSVAFIGFRLRASYRQINLANQELASLNESLEQRVTERTRDLSNALDELKESQVQLVQAEKMSSLGQLVAGISHEINTPLLYLANNASMIKERVEPLSDFVRRSAETLSLKPSDFDDRSKYQTSLINGLRALKILLHKKELEAAVEEVIDLNEDSIEGLTDLTQMAQSLKDFSRLDRAPIDSFDVNAGIDKTLTIARNIVKHKAEVRKLYGELPQIECSPSKINQVFLNLITNAAQAIEDQGEIVISTKLRDDDHVMVSITDTGCGIPHENLAKIRDPFFTTKEVGTGTGLGLSIVDEIVRSHGGELLVDSRLGAGSTFSVVLPIKQRRNSSSGDDNVANVDSKLAEAV